VSRSLQGTVIQLLPNRVTGRWSAAEPSVVVVAVEVEVVVIAAATRGEAGGQVSDLVLGGSGEREVVRCPPAERSEVITALLVELLVVALPGVAVDEPGLLLDLGVQVGEGRVGFLQLALDFCEDRGQGLPATAGPLGSGVELLFGVAGVRPESALLLMELVAFGPQGLEVLDGSGVFGRDRLG
jgi:hypothetical protein